MAGVWGSALLLLGPMVQAETAQSPVLPLQPTVWGEVWGVERVRLPSCWAGSLRVCQMPVLASFAVLRGVLSIPQTPGLLCEGVG